MKILFLLYCVNNYCICKLVLWNKNIIVIIITWEGGRGNSFTTKMCPFVDSSTDSTAKFSLPSRCIENAPLSPIISLIISPLIVGRFFGYSFSSSEMFPAIRRNLIKESEKAGSIFIRQIRSASRSSKAPSVGATME